MARELLEVESMGERPRLPTLGVVGIATIAMPRVGWLGAQMGVRRFVRAPANTTRARRELARVLTTCGEPWSVGPTSTSTLAEEEIEPGAAG